MDAEAAPLTPGEYLHLCALAVREWDAGTPVPSLDTIRTRGTREQYAEAVNILCDHDDEQRARGAPLSHHTTPKRGD